MNKIVNARFIRSVQQEGKTTADVEFSMETNPTQKYLATLQNTDGQSYQLAKIYKNNATYELDWYDNDQRQAFVEVTGDFLNDASMSLNRESLVEDILASEGVKSDMYRAGV